MTKYLSDSFSLYFYLKIIFILSMLLALNFLKHVVEFIFTAKTFSFNE
jgi:hypothetical protein